MSINTPSILDKISVFHANLTEWLIRFPFLIHTEQTLLYT